MNTVKTRHTDLMNEMWEQWTGQLINEKRDVRAHWVIKRLEQRQNIKSIIDIACGPGWHSKLFSDEGYTVTGTDISARAIAKAKVFFPHIRFHDTSVEDLDLKEHFDASVCLASFNMFEDEKKAMDVISTISNWGYLGFVSRLLDKCHLRKYDLESTKELLQSYGKILTIEEIPDLIMVEIKFNEK